MTSINITQSGIIYLVQPAELVGTNRYKIGMSLNTELERVKTGYKKGTRYIYIGECINARELENKIKNIFKNKFNLIAGTEYFEGNEKEIEKEFFNIIFEHKNTHTIPINKTNIIPDRQNQQMNITNNNQDSTNENKYVCEYCNKSFNKKCHYTRHIKRIYPCYKIIITNYGNTNINNSDNLYKNQIKPNFPQNISNNNEDSLLNKQKQQLNITNNNNQDSTNENKYVCEYCNNIFKNKYNLKIHTKFRCKVLGKQKVNNTNHDINQDTKQDNIDSKIYKCDFCLKKFDRKFCLNRHLETCKNKLEDLDKESKTDLIATIKELKNKINNLKKNINNSNNSNNINSNKKIANFNLIMYGKENLDFLTEEDKIKILNSGCDSIIKLTEIIHCNENHPEYSNIRITNLRSNIIKKYDGKKFIAVKRKPFLQELINKKIDCIMNWIDDIEKNNDNSEKVFNNRGLYDTKNILNKVNTQNKLINDITLLIYNYCDK
jgi:hypothetical protein